MVVRNGWFVLVLVAAACSKGKDAAGGPGGERCLEGQAFWGMSLGTFERRQAGPPRR